MCTGEASHVPVEPEGIHGFFGKFITPQEVIPHPLTSSFNVPASDRKSKFLAV
jgi:hypothetical protein